jgi:hypothetical protein
MRITHVLAVISLTSVLAGCPTRVVYDVDGGSGGAGGAGLGGRAGQAGAAGHDGAAGQLGSGGPASGGSGGLITSGAGGTMGGGGGGDAGSGTGGIGGVVTGGQSGSGSGGAPGTGGAAGTGAAGAPGTGGAAGTGGVTGVAGKSGGGGAGGMTGCVATQGVIDFEDLATTQAFAAVSLPYLYAGFSLGTDSPDGLSAVGTKAIQYLNTTGLIADYNATITLTRNDGKPFTLLGIDLSPYNDAHPGIVYSFVGKKTDGSTISQDVPLRNKGLGFVPYTLPASFDDLLSVSWTMNMADAAQYFDNIRYSFCPGS